MTRSKVIGTTTADSASPGSKWRRFWRWLTRLEAQLELGYEGRLDQRITYIETELAALRRRVEALCAESADPTWAAQRKHAAKD